MKNRIKKSMALLLAAIMLLTTAPLAGFDGLFVSKASAAYFVGNHIKYGNYPQSKVTNSSTLLLLNSKSKKWKSYRYYSGSGSTTDGKMKPSDYMYYADIDIDGDGLRDYRAVKIDKYRPYYTGYTSSSSYSYQDENGYTTGNIYYFKFEPIEWRILNPTDGLIMTKKIMDSQAYNNYLISTYSAYWGNADKTYYANDYYNSSIRQWLNYDFYNTAFTFSQASNIRKDVTLNNDCYSSSFPKYNSKECNDKIFLLSYNEAETSAYGFNSSLSKQDTARKAQGTDYAKSQGLYVHSNNYARWWLRSPGSASASVWPVLYYGECNYMTNAYQTFQGIRPVCRLYNLKNDISKSSINNNIGSGSESSCSNGHMPYTENNAVAPTCTKTGLTASTHCSVCDELISEQKEIPALGHTDSNSDGKCDRCGITLGEPEKPNTPDTPTSNCTHLCHKGGFIWRIVRFFWKLFKINRNCSCGVAHY